MYNASSIIGNYNTKSTQLSLLFKITRMKKIFQLFVIATFSFVQSANGQSSPEEVLESKPTFKHALGMHAGAVTGLGFSYRYAPKKWGIQVTGIPIFSAGNIFASTAASVQYKFKSHDKVDLFTYLGVHNIYERSEYYYGLYEPFDGYDAVYTNNTLTAGFGAGLNIHLLEVIQLSVQAGYGLYDLSGWISTNLTGEIGVYYRF